MTEPALTALVINCTLKSSPAPSSSGKLASELMAEFEKQGVTSTIVRAADYTISPGVEADMGNGDQWPEIRTAMSSIAQRVLERLDAELSETDEGGRYRTYGKVAAAVIVGNEDGAHAISAALFQTLNDVGFSLAPNAVTYWNGEALGTVDYTDLDETPEGVASATHMVASNAAHLAALLHEKLYPPLG
jgi:multimeric flavodoxin WrbA